MATKKKVRYSVQMDAEYGVEIEKDAEAAQTLPPTILRQIISKHYEGRVTPRSARRKKIAHSATSAQPEALAQGDGQ